MFKVLVVEDEQMIRKGIILTVNWESLDCIVAGEATNGVEGLEAVKNLTPDIIICDIKMPKMDGLEMLKQLRQMGNNTPVIFLTAYDTFSYIQSALRLGAIDYILKPFHDGELERAVLLIKNKITAKETNAPPNDFPPLKSGEKNKYIFQAMEFIRMYYNTPDLSVGMIANYLQISEGYLSHLFKKASNLGPLNFLTHYRIYQSKLLLQDYRVTVYEVAEKVGYRDIAYFSSTFKKIVGISPSEYQIQCQNKSSQE